MQQASPATEGHPQSGAALAGNAVLLGDNLELLKALPAGFADLIYIDPPFNTGRKQERRTLRSIRDSEGRHTGFGGERYRSEILSRISYSDAQDDYLGFLAPRLEQARRILKPSGSLFVHLDSREVHYCKVALDQIFGRRSFLNEIIWAYDYGGRSRRRWPSKHDHILWYAVDAEDYVFNYDQIDRIPYMAPGLVGPEKAKRGKTPTDVWWHTIVPTNSQEKTGYPSQKPLRLIERIVWVHSRPGDTLVDFFAGSGTLGEAAARNRRRFLLIDDSPLALEVMEKRLAPHSPQIWQNPAKTDLSRLFSPKQGNP